MKDPEGANLDRIQIVKGWVNEQGESAERIYNIALSNQRLADPVSGDIAPVGNTVDANTGSYDNSIGDVKLAAFWRDPDFDPRQQVFYYARVLKIPTPRDGLPSMHSSSDSNRHNRSAYKNVQSPLQSGTNRSMKSPLARNDT